MDKPKRVCVFCGSTPLTIEHHPPKWIAECFPNNPNVVGERFFRRIGQDLESRGEGRGYALLEYKMACKSCNNGWMSELENLAKPVLAPMIRGDAVRLSPLGQRHVASWVAKSALTAGVMHGWDNAAHFREVYADFFHARRPDDDYEINIAACETNNMVSCVYDTSQPYLLHDSKGTTAFDGFYYVGLFGHFVATVRHRPAGARGRVAQWPKAPFLEIWPRDGTGPIRKAWPPDPRLTVDEVNALIKGPNPKPHYLQPSSPIPPKKI